MKLYRIITLTLLLSLLLCISFYGNTNRAAAEEDIPSYAPEGRYLWDSWILVDEVDGEKIYRLYHLDAPDNGDPDSRHDKASIRQAISKDLINWEDLGTTFSSGPDGAWDDGPIWTGNVYKVAQEEYLFFYTARNHRDGQLQRVGLAKSADGINWERSDKPLVVPDSRWYETIEISPIYRAWRDPAVVKDEERGKYLMYITAKTKEGHEKYKGCIALAVADNIEGPYEVQAPVLAPGLYAEMEVPQIIQRDGKVYLFFSTWVKDYAPDWAEQIGGPVTGLHCFVGESLYGPFEPLGGTGVVTGIKDNLYTVKLVPDPEREGEYVAIGWYIEDEDGEKGLTLARPMKVIWEGDNITIEEN